jgi:hypothetical protein
MQFFIAIILAGFVIFLFGLGCFLNFWRTRKRWWWTISVFAMSIGITLMTFWWKL